MHLRPEDVYAALARSVPWRTWRYAAPEYRAAVTALAEAPAVKGPPAAPPPPRDPALAVPLAECGVRVEGGTVLNDLLADLGTRSR
ncbi:DUF2399 domain-containing protein [Streptomyces sp. NPDC127100]|uniref:DUF2399 domain-containing protein n=1 Tax=Streptomyces sp. NPDC127100 TaxID=3347138 RepID=UPI0036541EBB